jgi:catechol 2,3-dioxygenase-like lactoylglutathione lyase family enzyme
MTTFMGVDHVGVGVGDLDAAIEFYGRHVGFDRVLFEYAGDLPGLEPYAGRVPRARVAMLENGGATPIGAGRVKLVQVLDGAGPPPVPEGQAWGEVGVCEICLHVRNVQDVYESLVAAGCDSLMEPMSADVPPAGVTLDIAYVADPWGTKLELIEWTGLWRSLPGPARAEGVNHVAFGVTDMARTRAFYEQLGFTELLFESFDFFDPMAPWYRPPWYDPAALPRQHMAMPMAPQGAAIEPTVLDPPGHDCRGEWGHLGPMDFGIRVANIDAAVAALRSAGVEMYGDPRSLSVDGGEWRYVAFAEPDGNYVSLVEPRY